MQEDKREQVREVKERINEKKSEFQRRMQALRIQLADA